MDLAAPALVQGNEQVGRLGCAGLFSSTSCGRADESHLTGESEDVLKRPGGAALMLSGAKARSPALVSVPDGPAPDGVL